MKRKEFLKMTAALAGAVSFPGSLQPPDFRHELEGAAAAGDDEDFWRLIRGQFLLDPDWTYLNFGGLGACALPVLNSNDALFYALGKACEFVETIGLGRIWQHNHGLAELFYAGLREIPGVEMLSPEEESYRSAMIGFRMKTHEHTKINEHLAKDKIRVRAVTEGGLNWIRVSFHICNHAGEVTQILESLKKLGG